MLYYVTTSGSKMPGEQLSPIYDRFSAAKDAAEDIRAFTGQPCRVWKIFPMWVTK